MKKISQSFIDRVSELLIGKVDFGFILGPDAEEYCVQSNPPEKTVCWWKLSQYSGEVVLADFHTAEDVRDSILGLQKVPPSFNPSVSHKALVSFGNYLFHRYDVQVHSDDGQNVPMYLREVSHADLENWKVGWEIENNKLPSKFQNGDSVTVNLWAAGKVENAEVIKVHFSKSKVLYDIDVEIAQGEYTRLYNIDSVFVEPTE